jgi:class 3 adenylate cyclase
MDVRLLGPLEVEEGGCVVPIAGVKERALLALLVLRANRLVSLELLIDELWGERPPATARHTLEAHVSRLRRALAAGGCGGLIERDAGGYRIQVREGQLDVLRFERLVGEGERALAGGDAAGADESLTAALACWRGSPLADVAFAPSLAAEAGRLEELRVGAVEARAAAALALGRHAELVPALRSLLAEQPLRERPRAQLMLALYRCGRQAEALAVYQDGRRRLDELGLEPGHELQELQRAILRHDRELERPPAADSEPLAGTAAAGAAAAALPERRKVVTVLFCEASGPTVLAETLDPEALRALLSDHFERVKAIVERHGGTIDNAAGDAVMAVFGVPLLHEDDALRACRAALEMRETLPELGLACRIGVDTGEVITGSAQRLVTGAAVSLAARLQRAAQPGEILLGQGTLQQVRGLVRVEPGAPLRLTSRPGSVPVSRLLALTAEPQAKPETPFVGRATELQRLRGVLAQAIHDHTCQLVTILGPAGVGKTRLAAELLTHVDARVVQGRCLPYGEGITYWPVIELLRQLRIRPAEPDAATPIAALLGESPQPTRPEEVAWAFRKTLETAAAEQPLVCIFEDLHWAEPTLLDLIEHIADLSRDAPLLVLCLARPELLDDRPGWAGGTANATSLLLQPLTPAESRRLVDQLGGLTQAAREQILAHAEGNPLFLEEMLALAHQHADGGLIVPPTIQALLAARLDRLDPPERTVLEHAAVEGKHFHPEAVQTLLPDEPALTTQLQALVHRDLIRPQRMLTGETYCFRHQLIRDAAYDRLPKTQRADLHRRFATWLDVHDTGLVELDEFVGYHLEQACRYGRELDEPVGAELSAEAHRRLVAAGRRAYHRGDYAASINLLERAAALLEGQLDPFVEDDVVQALWYSGKVGEAYARMQASAERAADAGDRSGELCLRLLHGMNGLWIEPEGAAERLAVLVEQALPLFEAEGDHLCLTRAHAAALFVAYRRGLFDDAAAAADRALEHARLGAEHRLPWLFAWAGQCRIEGSTPVPEVVAWLDERDGAGEAVGFLCAVRAEALAMLGRLDEARSILGHERAVLAEQGAGTALAIATSVSADVELCIGDAEAAERLAEQACRQYEQLGIRQDASQLATLAWAQCALDRLDEAERNARRAAKLAPSEEVVTQTLRRQVEAKVLARRGRHADAERLAREAVAMGDEIQWLNGQAHAYADLAETLALAGKTAAARDALRQALDRFERKGNLVEAERVRVKLAELGHDREAATPAVLGA